MARLWQTALLSEWNPVFQDHTEVQMAFQGITNLAGNSAFRTEVEKERWLQRRKEARDAVSEQGTD